MSSVWRRVAGPRVLRPLQRGLVAANHFARARALPALPRSTPDGRAASGLVPAGGSDPAIHAGSAVACALAVARNVRDLAAPRRTSPAPPAHGAAAVPRHRGSRRRLGRRRDHGAALRAVDRILLP